MPQVIGVSYFFFFSSRRRHTRCSRDWSSDVCSSDLHRADGEPAQGGHGGSGLCRRAWAPVWRVVSDRVKERDLACAPRLWWAKTMATPRTLNESRAGFEIDVLPLEPAHLTSAHPRLGPHVKERREVRVDPLRRSE